LIEEFKECVHQDLRTHLQDENVRTLERAALISDDYLNPFSQEHFLVQKSE
jgi:hypothetical protein